MENSVFRSGYIGIIGRTNVGKSTLINKIFDKNVVITSDKAQTTRSRINCIYNTGEAQAIFVDCPGFFKPRNLLGEKLNTIIFNVLDDVDIIVVMVDFNGGIGIGDHYVFDQIKNRHVPKILLLNKIDLLNTAGKYSLPESISRIKSELGFFKEILPVSASTGENLETILELLIGMLPEGPMYYPDGMVTDMPANKMIAEIIREKLSANLFDELPHSVNVEVVSLQKKWTLKAKVAELGKGPELENQPGIQNAEVPGKNTGIKLKANRESEDSVKQIHISRQGGNFENNTMHNGGDSLIKIECNIYVEKKSHKAMIIGKSGAMLKKIGALSRIEIEKLLESKVFLKLWVKVEENWTRKEEYLDKFGY